MLTFSVLSSNNGVLVFLEAFKAGAEMTKLKFWLYIFISLSKKNIINLRKFNTDAMDFPENRWKNKNLV